MSEYDSDNPLMVEIMAEKATAYFTTIRKMDAALQALARFDETRPGGDAVARQALFSHAAEQVWFFVIQREAMRLPIYDELFAEFEIPDEVRRNMGPNLAARPPAFKG